MKVGGPLIVHEFEEGINFGHVLITANPLKRGKIAVAGRPRRATARFI
jgi:hypothetical protein